MCCETAIPVKQVSPLLILGHAIPSQRSVIKNQQMSYPIGESGGIANAQKKKSADAVKQHFKGSGFAATLVC
jgi:hypothetical protein